MFNKYSLLIVMCFLFATAGAQKKHDPIKVLIVDGFSNHDWKQTTKLIRQILEESGRFSVSVSTTPQTSKDVAAWANWNPIFENFDVVIQNTNNIFDRKIRWPEKIEKRLENYVRSGGGVYIFHSANNAFSDWKEYDKMIGLGWRSKETGFAIQVSKDGKLIRIPAGEGNGTGHGDRFNAQISIFTPHPINKGMPQQWKTASTEVYNYARGPAKNITILSVAFDSTATKKIWPVEWVVKYGKGNVYVSSMGHLWKGETYPISYRCIGFQTTLIRVVEWLGSKKATYPIPENFPTKQKISVRDETDLPGSS